MRHTMAHAIRLQVGDGSVIIGDYSFVNLRSLVLISFVLYYGRLTEGLIAMRLQQDYDEERIG